MIIRGSSGLLPKCCRKACCLRLIRALAVETHEDWLEASRYLNKDLLKEHKKLRLSLAA